MKGIDIGKDKVKKICDVLKRETLEPAKQEADEIIRKAEARAKQIEQEAENKAKDRLLEASKQIEREQNVFQSSLNQACKQALEALKQEIEDKLFEPELERFLKAPLEQPKILSELINAIVKAIEKEGLDADLKVYVSKAVPAKEINAILMQNVLQRLKNHTVEAELGTTGVAIKIDQSKITIDVTENALKELVSGYIRKDFREILFRS